MLGLVISFLLFAGCPARLLGETVCRINGKTRNRAGLCSTRGLRFRAGSRCYATVCFLVMIVRLSLLIISF